MPWAGIPGRCDLLDMLLSQVEEDAAERGKPAKIVFTGARGAMSSIPHERELAHAAGRDRAADKLAGGDRQSRFSLASFDPRPLALENPL
jgi:hypothetical protein